MKGGGESDFATGQGLEESRENQKKRTEGGDRIGFRGSVLAVLSSEVGVDQKVQTETSGEARRDRSGRRKDPHEKKQKKAVRLGRATE